MITPSNEAILTSAIFVFVPLAAFLILWVAGKRRIARMLGWVALAAFLISAGYMFLNTFIGFHRMSAFYLGVLLAVLVGLALGRALKQSNE